MSFARYASVKKYINVFIYKNFKCFYILIKQNNKRLIMNFIYWNSDTDIMIIPEGIIDLKKIAALDSRIKIIRHVDGNDIVSCGCYGTCPAVLSDIDYNHGTGWHMVECWYEKDKTTFPRKWRNTIEVEKGHELPTKIETLFKTYSNSLDPYLKECQAG